MSSETSKNDHQDQISRRAYDLWESEGRPDGEHERHWRQAEGLEFPDLSELESEGATHAFAIPDAPPVMNQSDTGGVGLNAKSRQK